mmetsp:Transcript_10301/g.22110  ORF Transcript_10301/g.22110 Transcript_10301/m.22110 type:complete len:106 (+) Transcript_10301:2789-3106(+)
MAVHGRRPQGEGQGVCGGGEGENDLVCACLSGEASVDLVAPGVVVDSGGALGDADAAEVGREVGARHLGAGVGPAWHWGALCLLRASAAAPAQEELQTLGQCGTR